MAKRRSETVLMPEMTHKPVNAPLVPFKKKENSEKLPSVEVVTSPNEMINADQKLFPIQTLENNVSECLKILDDTVMHAYVTKLGELPIIEPYFDEEKMKKEPYQFFHITKLVYEKDEFSVSKLSAIFQALSGKNCTLVLMVQNSSHITNFYLGVRDHEEKDFTGTLRQMLEMSLKGQFPGSDFSSDFSIENMQEITKSLANTTKAVSCVSCVPDFKQDKDFFENKDFLQGLEKFVISMQNKNYTAVFVADAVPYDELVAYRTQLESVCTQLSPFASIQFQISTSNSQSNANTEQTGQTNTKTKGKSETLGTNISFAKGETEGETNTKGTTQTHGINHSITDTESKGQTITDGTSESIADGITKTNTVTVGSTQTAGTSHGVSANANIMGIGGAINTGVFGSVSINESYSHSTAKSHTVTKGTNHSIAISDTISKALTKGVSDSIALSKNESKSKSTSNTQTHSISSQHGTNSSYSEAFNFGHAETITDTFGTSQGITMQSQNMMIVNMLERIKKQIVRLDECESTGMWNCAAYFMSSNRAISETAANTYHSLISGENSGVERSAINTWTNHKSLSWLITYITHFCHPKFAYVFADEPCMISPASLISTKELAIEMSLPRKSVCGLPVVEHAVFGQQIIRNDTVSNNIAKFDRILLGLV